MNAAATLFPPDVTRPRARAVTRPTPPPANDRVATSLEEMASLLAAHDANPFRIAAYREAAAVVRSLERPVADVIAAEGAEGLIRLPKIGRSLARTIEQLAATGTTPLLERLRGAADPERTLASVPGLGLQLSTRIHERLGIETLADLEAAAWDGRLATVPGLGPRRVRAIRESLAGRLGTPRRTPVAGRNDHEPPVAELLNVDAEYRKNAAGEHLPCVAPYRFNPTRAAWLPILHTERGERHYTALYSNTARAHSLGMTHDWVVIYRDDRTGHGQWTVVTARLGPLHGKRVVRGREQECVRHYEPAPAVADDLSGVT